MANISDLPLKGKKVVITRAQSQQSVACEMFLSNGAEVLELPALEITPPDKWDELDNALKLIDQFDWIIFSSANGVNYVEERLGRLNLSLSRLPASIKIASVGRKTEQRINQLGANVDYVPPDYVADSLIDNFPLAKEGLRILIPRVQTGGRNIMIERFEQEGAQVVEVSAYESKCPESIPLITLKAFEKLEVDFIVFTSGKTALNTAKLLKQYFDKDWNLKLKGVQLISIGPQTSISCNKYFNLPVKEAKPYNLNGLLNACIEANNAM